MFYSDNHVEVSLEAFLASEEYAKESIKDLKLSLGGGVRQKCGRLHTKKARGYVLF